jgi:hypothetical protein
MAIKYGILKGRPMPYRKYEPQTVLEKSNSKLHYDRSIITNWTILNNRSDIVILGKPIKEAYLIDVAIPNSHNFYSTITENLQKYTDLKEEIIRCGNWKRRIQYHKYYLQRVLSPTNYMKA